MSGLVPSALFLALLLVDAGGSVSHDATPRRPVELVRVWDGDTLQVRLLPGARSERGSPAEEKVRLIGVDAPEMGGGERPAEYGAREAARRAREWVRGRRLELVFDPGNAREGNRDRYGRLLAYVEDDRGEDLGFVLLREGRARLFRRFTFVRKDAYTAAEKEARRAGLGVWVGGGGAEFRHLRETEEAIVVYPAGGDLWAVCVSGSARVGIRTKDLPGLLREVRTTLDGARPADLPAALRRRGFVPTPSCLRP